MQRHPGNPWKEELQVLLARAEAGEDVTVEVIDLLSPNENIRRWMWEQTDTSVNRFRGYEQLPGRLGVITASNSWICPHVGCTKSLPVIQEGEDPPACEVHRVPMFSGRSSG